MAGPLDLDDDMRGMVPRQGKPTAKGGLTFQRPMQHAERVIPARSGASRSVRGGDQRVRAVIEQWCLKWPEAQ